MKTRTFVTLAVVAILWAAPAFARPPGYVVQCSMHACDGWWYNFWQVASGVFSWW